MPPETNRLFVHVKILPCLFPGQIASFRSLVKTVSIPLRPERYLTLVISGGSINFSMIVEDMPKRTNNNSEM